MSAIIDHADDCVARIADQPDQPCDCRAFRSGRKCEGINVMTVLDDADIHADPYHCECCIGTK